MDYKKKYKIVSITDTLQSTLVTPHFSASEGKKIHHEVLSGSLGIAAPQGAQKSVVNSRIWG